MIIVHLIGGLGNQLFQYAMGRRAAHSLNTTLKLDITGFEKYKLRKYSLNRFNIVEDLATEKEIIKFKRHISLLKLKESLRPYYKRHFLKEKFFHFDSNVLDLIDNTYITGYWQSEKYFSDIEYIIRKEYSLRESKDAIDEELGEHIQTVNSVSLHIRRGDYISNPKNNEIFANCNLDYYQHAIDKISNMISHPKFFIFSDDINWVKKNFRCNNQMSFIDHGPGRDYLDLSLMASCKHHIIANSSFSWWGAWLGENEDKIVLAPSNWFIDPKYDTKDLIPSTWKLI